ncbi:AAA family ATPase [Brasilonema sp. UFV-L1]|uniref:AAA family ATPase n=1 Tax=Brasilonema sp. UFV-L1 TaxID=2234130 RepID=UPI00145F09F7|nr:AAA family ATPase [Brasilonema sp. UFV-L1]NMG09766.1 hypothetical protein [Brasilonema sp. UFV-L1]
MIPDFRNFAWSREQKDIFRELAVHNLHILIEAVAGSGKSTTLKGIVAHLSAQTKIRIFAFNKSVADKLEAELPSRVKVGTAHSYGYALLMRALRGYESAIEVDDYKYHRIADKLIQRLLIEYADNSNRLDARYPNLHDERVLKALKSSYAAFA